MHLFLNYVEKIQIHHCSTFYELRMMKNTVTLGNMIKLCSVSQTLQLRNWESGIFPELDMNASQTLSYGSYLRAGSTRLQD